MLALLIFLEEMKSYILVFFDCFRQKYKKILETFNYGLLIKTLLLSNCCGFGDAIAVHQ
ncbi:hypothetical protein D3C87_168140 [compost metagenome]